MTEIVINGTSHEIEIDNMGLTFVDGVFIDVFLEGLSGEDIAWLAKYGLGVAHNEPEHFDDIAERIEMPRDVKATLDQFKTSTPPTKVKKKI